MQLFFEEERWNIYFMLLISCIINVFQTNIISYISSRIILLIQKNNSKEVYQYFTYFVGVSFVYLILYCFYKYLQSKFITKMRQWVKFQLVRIILLINNENFSNINFTKLSPPINRIASVCFMVFTDIITLFLPNFMFLFMVASYFLYKNFIFGAGFILSNILIFIYLYMNWSEIMKTNENYESYVNDVDSYIIEILNGIDKFIHRGQSKNEIYAFDKKCNKTIDSAYSFYAMVNYHITIMSIILYCILFASILYLITMYFTNAVDLTTFITFFTILLMYRDRMSTIIQQIPDYIEFNGRIETSLEYFEDMNMDNNLIAKMNKKYDKTELLFEKIDFENVSFRYSSELPLVMENFNMDISTIKNKIIGITGLSGKGKSTFAKLILKLHYPTTGKIYIDGRDIEDIDTDYIRENITYVNQNSKLFDRKIIDNFLYGCTDPDQCKDNLQEVMKYTKIRDLYKNVDIYEKNAGSLGENLSGGQRMIVNVVGGLINPSKILILDEPTNALDPELKRELIAVIRDFKKYKQSIIIISHDKECFALFDEKIQI